MAVNKFARSKYTSIKGLSQARRLPRLGKIRLGIKKVSAKTGKEYPAEVDYFVCPPEVQKVYGEKPKELDVIIPVEDEAMFFPQALKWYTQTKLMCKGDGETAIRLDPKTGEMFETDCPCEKLDSGECSQKAHLMVMLPKVSMGGVWQIDTGSVNNIIEINSSIEMIRSLCGRIALIPLKLRRVPTEIIVEGTKRTKHLLQLIFPGGIEEVKAYREGAILALKKTENLALPEPVEDGPDPTPCPTEVVDEDEPVKDAEIVSPAPPSGEASHNPPSSQNEAEAAPQASASSENSGNGERKKKGKSSSELRGELNVLVNKLAAKKGISYEEALAEASRFEGDEGPVHATDINKMKIAWVAKSIERAKELLSESEQEDLPF